MPRKKGSTDAKPRQRRRQTKEEKDKKVKEKQERVQRESEKAKACSKIGLQSIYLQFLSIYNFISNVRVLRLVGLLLPAYPLERHFTSTGIYCCSAVLREAQKRLRAKIEIL
jgi:hypothetical protein